MELGRGRKKPNSSPCLSITRFHEFIMLQDKKEEEEERRKRRRRWPAARVEGH